MKAPKFLLTCLTCATVLSSGFTANAMVMNNNTGGAGEIPGSRTLGRGLTDSRLGDLSSRYSFGNNFRSDLGNNLGNNFRTSGVSGISGTSDTSDTSRSIAGTQGYNNNSTGTGTYGYSSTFNNFDNGRGTGVSSDMNYRGFTGSNSNYYENANIPSVAAYPNTPNNLGTAVNTDNSLNTMYRSGRTGSNNMGTTGYRGTLDNNYTGSANYPSPSYRNGDLGNTGENYDYYTGGSSVSRTTPRRAVRNTKSINMNGRMRNSSIDQTRTGIRATDNNNTNNIAANKNITANKGMTSARGTTAIQNPVRNQTSSTKSGLQTKTQTQAQAQNNNNNNSNNSNVKKSVAATKTNTAQTPAKTTQQTTATTQKSTAKANTAQTTKATQTTQTTKSAIPQNQTNTSKTTAKAQTQRSATNNTAMTNRASIGTAGTTRTTNAVSTANNANNANNSMTRNNNNYSFRNRDNMSGYDYNNSINGSNNGSNYRGGSIYRNNGGYAMDRYGDDYRNTDNINSLNDYRGITGYRNGGYRDYMRDDFAGNYRADIRGNAYGASGFDTDTDVNNRTAINDRAATGARTNTVTRNNTAAPKTTSATNATRTTKSTNLTKGTTGTTPAITKAKNTATTVAPRFDSARNTTTRAAANRAVRYRDTVTESRNATITFVILLVAIAALLALSIYALMRPRYDRVTDNDSASRRR